jgi:hypothetical protein
MRSWPLWQVDGSIIKPVAIVLRCNEPIVLDTVLPELGTVPGLDGAPTPSLLGAKKQPICGPDLSQSLGIERLVIAQSGFAAVLFLNSDAQRDGVILKLRRQWSWDVGHRSDLPLYPAISLTSVDLKSRDLLLLKPATGPA